MEKDEVLSLFDSYADSVYRVALSYLGSRQEAEDVTQNVFLKLLESDINIYRGREKAFLTKMTVNRCKNIIRSAKSHETVPLEDAPLFSRPGDGEIFRAVAALPEKYRIAVILHCVEGYSLAETAAILRVGASAVSMRLHRARKILKEEIGRN